MNFMDNCKELIKKAFPISWKEFELEQVLDFECIARSFVYDDLKQDWFLDSLLRMNKTNENYVVCMDCYNGDFVDSIKIK